MDATTFRESTSDAIRYWEPKRLLYNAVLTAVVVTYFVLGLPGSKHLVSLNGLLFVFLLAVLANVAYCAAYVVDIFAQNSEFRVQWRNYRWTLFAVGSLFAAILTRFWSLGIFLHGKP